MRDKGKFVPGMSGNPKGRPPRGESLAELLWTELTKEHGDSTKGAAIIERLVDMALDEKVNLPAIKIITGMMLETDRMIELELLKADIEEIKKYMGAA